MRCVFFNFFLFTPMTSNNPIWLMDNSGKTHREETHPILSEESRTRNVRTQRKYKDNRQFWISIFFRVFQQNMIFWKFLVFYEKNPDFRFIDSEFSHNFFQLESEITYRIVFIYVHRFLFVEFGIVFSNILSLFRALNVCFLLIQNIWNIVLVLVI